MKYTREKSCSIFHICITVLLVALVSGCAGIPGDQGLAEKKTSTLSPEEQINLATGEFLKIYELSQADRDANLGKMIAGYEKIIGEYPEAPLAQESYWHLIQIMQEDFRPPKKDEALKLFGQFTRDYPESPLKNAVSDTVMRFLYQHNLWPDLLALTKPYAQNIDEITATPKTPLPLFMYSEARYHLDDKQEAEQGYEVILKYFPSSLMAKIARTRMTATKK